MSRPDGKPEFDTLLRQELACFSSDEMRKAFDDASIVPCEVIERWAYGDEVHRCWVIAKNAKQQIVYC